MAKILLLIVFVAIITIADSAAAPGEQANIDKYVKQANLALNKCLDDVIASAPPAKKKEAIDATSKQRAIFERALTKAVKTGSLEKVRDIAWHYDFSAAVIMKAPPAIKLEKMEEAFNVMAAPDRKDCPNVDKSYCETIDKLEKASDDVRSAVVTPGDKKKALQEAIRINMEFIPALNAINKAYADEDDKEITKVLATYNKCAEAILAAAPAEKLKVMKETIAAAASRPSRKP